MVNLFEYSDLQNSISCSESKLGTNALCTLFEYNLIDYGFSIKN